MATDEYPVAHGDAMDDARLPDDLDELIADITIDGLDIELRLCVELCVEALR